MIYTRGLYWQTITPNRNGNVIRVERAGFISLYLEIPYLLTIS